jgi:hypothetical protein
MTARQHLDLLGLLFVVYGGMNLLVGLFLVLMFGVGGIGMGVAGATGGDQDLLIMGGVYGVAAIFAGVLVLGFALAYVAVGIGLRRRSSWSRIGGIVLGALALMSMPLGTALGIYALIKLLDPEVRGLIEAGPAPAEDPLA